MARPFTKITEQIFNHVKILLKGGAKQREAAELLGVSVNTICRIATANTYEDYVNFTREHGGKKYREQKEGKPEEVVKEIRSTVTVQATHYMEEQLRKTNELLTGISAKLAVIIDDLYGTGVKKNAEPDN